MGKSGRKPTRRMALLGLLLAVTACAHGGGEPVALPEESFPTSDDPMYSVEVLNRRAELMRAI